MKYRHLILTNLFRKKIRTGLTVGSFAVALFLFGLLAVVRGAFQQGVHTAGADRLVVINKISFIQPMPLAYRDRLLRVPGVTQATFANWFGGVYQDERNFFPQFAIDREHYREVFTELSVPDDQWRAFLADREACIVGETLMQRFKWQVGDRIPIRGTIFPGTWEFNIRGVYRGQRRQDDTAQFWFRWDYLDERKQFGKGFVGWYTVRIANPDDAVRVVKAIDEGFANSPWETKTDTEKSFAASWVKQMGNIEFLMLSIGGVVFFTLLLVTGNTMAYTGLALGKTVRFGGGTWTVVGVFDAGGSAFDSELWCDANVLNQVYQRPQNIFQSVTVRLTSAPALTTFKDALTADPRLTVQVDREVDYYQKQSQMLTTLITVLGTLVALVMGIGAVFGALNTMYSAVAERAREIATMRALGFGVGSVVTSFVIEALCIAFGGGVLGCVAVLPLNGFTTGTINWQTFSHLAFAFRITPLLLVLGLAFALLMGLVGGVPPAIRAARQPIAVALREL